MENGRDKAYQHMHTWANAIEELKRIGVLETNAHPVGGFAEWLVCDVLGFERAKSGTEGYDATDSERMKYQIKARRVEKIGDAGIRFSTGIDTGSKGFDFLIAVIFGLKFEALRVMKIPWEVCLEGLKFSSYRRAGIFTLTKEIMETEGVEDLTDRFKF